MKRHRNSFRSFNSNFAFHWSSDDEYEESVESSAEFSSDERDDDDDEDGDHEHNLDVSAEPISTMTGLLGNMEHVRCAAHKIDKLGSKDALKAIEKSTEYKGVCIRDTCKDFLSPCKQKNRRYVFHLGSSCLR